MHELPEFGSVHPYLNYVENFIKDIGGRLADESGLLLERREIALLAIDKVIRELSPLGVFGCPRAQLPANFERSSSVLSEKKN